MKDRQTSMDETTIAMIINGIEERQGEMIRFLQKLIQINSVTGIEGEIQAFLADYMQKLGLAVDVFEPEVDRLRHYPGFVEPDLSFSDRPNVVAVWDGEGGGRSLLLNGHVDTVPLGPADQWLHPPLSGVLKDDVIWGRGASDMKAGVAAMVMAIVVLKELGIQPRGRVILETVVDEERTGIGTLACVDRGYRADAGICCETSDLHVMPACIGRMWFTIRLRGKPAGISARWESVSAIEKGMKIVDAIEDLERIRIAELTHPLYPDNRGALPCAVTMFHSGTFPSITPEEAVLRGSMGLMPYEDLQEVEDQLRAQVMRVALNDPWLKNNLPELTTEGGYVAAGAEIPADHPIVETLMQMFFRATGSEAMVSGRKGAADTRFLTRLGDTPSVIFGPGVTAQMHAMNENVPVKNLIASTQTLALAINEWCNQPSRKSD